ncbi:MAG: hypothetical protein WCF84_19090 [Anaerolineae bacterium]
MWFDRFTRFRLAGPGRSFLDAYWQFREGKAELKGLPAEDLARNSAEKRGNSGIPQSWRNAARRWDWQARAEAWDAVELQRVEIEQRQRRDAILNRGMALLEERVDRLNELATLLWGDLKTDDKRWLPDVKLIGQGEQAERVDLVRFNSGLINQFRGALDDIAVELGGRQRGVKLNGSVTVGVTEVTADELAKAATEMKDWEQQFDNEPKPGN